MKVPYLTADFLAGIGLARREEVEPKVRPPRPAVPSGREEPAVVALPSNGHRPPVAEMAVAPVADPDAWIDAEERRRWRLMLLLLVGNLVLTAVAAGVATWYLRAASHKEAESTRKLVNEQSDETRRLVLLRTGR